MTNSPAKPPSSAPPGAEYLAEYDLISIVGFMFDNTQAAARLAFGGVMERCPGLKVIVPHLGGAFHRKGHGMPAKPGALLFKIRKVLAVSP